MWKTLQAFGFNPDFLSYVKVLYCDIESILKINGGLCAPFKVCRGVRQGCSLSGLLYTLAIEPLLSVLRRVLEGVPLPNCEVSLCLSAYADDVIIMTNNQNDVDLLLKSLKDFGLISSARINWNKSEAVLMGKWKNRVPPNLPEGLGWTRDGLRYLGVYLGNETIVQRIGWELLKNLRADLKNGNGLHQIYHTEDVLWLLIIWWLPLCGTGWLALIHPLIYLENPVCFIGLFLGQVTLDTTQHSVS